MPNKELSNHSTMRNKGIKRKRGHGSSTSKPPLITNMEIMLEAKEVMKSVTDNLDQTIIMHTDIISKINKMNKVKRKKVTIAIVGKSGEGKSSLLSAILGKKNLLPSGSFGACTSVITQVEANLNDSNYTAEIEFISKEEWEKELKDHLKVLLDESDDRNEDLFEIAVEKITALYGADADKKTLEELKKDVKYAEIEKLLSIVKETQNSKKISKSDVSKFAKDIACYVLNSKSSHGGWFWPIVKSVTIKIPNCRELLEHIVLVDLPGTGDCNKIRDDLWKSKLKECSSVWIVSDINRAATDRDPWGILKHCMEELGPGGECININFICTKTDEIDPEAYMRDARLAENQISEDKDQKKMCILHRNKLAKTSVKEKFEKSEIKRRFSIDNNFLQVFTVSCNAFFRVNASSSLKLDSTETEIPNLQDDLRSLNNSINLELVRDYISEAMGVLSLIKSVQLDRNKKTAEKKVTIRTELETNLKKALNELDKYYSNIHNDLKQRLSQGVKESVNSCVSSTKALIASKRNGRGFHRTLHALCKNYGCFWPKKRNEVIDLNKKLVKPLHNNIDEYFNLIFPVSGKTGKSVQEQIGKFTIISSDSAYCRSSMLRHIQSFIKAEENKLKATVNKDIVELKKEIFSSIIKTIQDEMAPSYEEAAALTGTGSMKERQELLIATVDKKKQDMFNKAKIEALKKLNNLKLYIKDAFETGLKEAMNVSLSQDSKIKSMDVSKETEHLDRLSAQLSDCIHQANKKTKFNTNQTRGIKI